MTDQDDQNGGNSTKVMTEMHMNEKVEMSPNLLVHEPDEAEKRIHSLELENKDLCLSIEELQISLGQSYSQCSRLSEAVLALTERFPWDVYPATREKVLRANRGIESFRERPEIRPNLTEQDSVAINKELADENIGLRDSIKELERDLCERNKTCLEYSRIILDLNKGIMSERAKSAEYLAKIREKSPRSILISEQQLEELNDKLDAMQSRAERAEELLKTCREMSEIHLSRRIEAEERLARLEGQENI